MFVPPGGGEADYGLSFEMPAVPNPGDYISINRKGEEAAGHEDFIVRRTWWTLTTPEARTHHYDADDRIGIVDGIMCECEFALGSWSSEQHKKNVAMYESRGKGVREFEASAY